VDETTYSGIKAAMERVAEVTGETAAELKRLGAAFGPTPNPRPKKVARRRAKNKVARASRKRNR
jgi:hypothetical protein